MTSRKNRMIGSLGLGAVLLLSGAGRIGAQGAPPAAAPALKNLPDANQTKAYAAAEKAFLIPDLGVVEKLYAGEESAGSEMSLGGFAFLEAFTGIMLKADSAPEGAETPVRG